MDRTDIIAFNMRALRKSHNFTQSSVAKWLNIQRQTYSNYETGKRSPSHETLLALSQLYQVPIAVFWTPMETNTGQIAGQVSTSNTYAVFSMINDYNSLSIQAQDIIQELISFFKAMQA